MSNGHPAPIVRYTLPLLLALLTNRAGAAPPSLLDIVRRYADTMLDRGRDTYGPQKSGLLLSALDRTTLVAADGPAGPARRHPPRRPLRAAVERAHRRQPAARPEPAPRPLRAQRDHRRPEVREGGRRGADLVPQEHPLAQDRPAALGRAHVLGRDGGPARSPAATSRCTSSPGPGSLWDRCFELAPEESKRFALGLWEHQIANHQTGGFDRHAPYFEHGPVDGKDFPRHAGFYIADLGPRLQAHEGPDVSQGHRDAAGAVRAQARAEGRHAWSPPSARWTARPPPRLVPEPLAERLPRVRREGGRADPGGPAEAARCWRRPSHPARPPLWQTGYSAGTQASTAMFCLARYEQVAQARLPRLPHRHRRPLRRFLARGRPGRLADGVRPRDQHPGGRLSLHRAPRLPRAGRSAWRRLAVELFWQDNPLPRASLKTGHYEAITGADSLALALLEVHAITHRLAVNLPSNTIDR